MIRERKSDKTKWERQIGCVGFAVASSPKLRLCNSQQGSLCNTDRQQGSLRNTDRQQGSLSDTDRQKGSLSDIGQQGSLCNTD